MNSKIHIAFAILVAAVAVVLQTSCSRRSETSTIKDFAQTIGDYLPDRNVDALVKRCSIKANHVYDWQKELAKQQGASELILNKPLTDDALAEASREVLDKFIHSYDDLLDGELHSFSAREDTIDKFCTMILWIKKDNAYHGVYVHAAIQTKDGFRVMDWLGPIAYPGRSFDSLVSKRLILSVDRKEDCQFPRSGLRFKYQFIEG